MPVVLGLPLSVDLAGLLAFVGGLWRLWQLLSWEGGHVVWAHAFREFADEYGTDRLGDDAQGMSLSTVTDGARLEVVVQPRGEPPVSLWCGRLGLQALLVTAVSGSGASRADGRWRLAGRRGPWEI